MRDHVECINCEECHQGYWLADGNVGPFCQRCYEAVSRRQPPAFEDDEPSTVPAGTGDTWAAPLRKPVVARSEPLSLHRCKICGTRWLLWPAGVGGTVDATWNLLDKYSTPGACCDNVAMGDQIEHLRDLPLPVASRREPSDLSAVRTAVRALDAFRDLRRRVTVTGSLADYEAAVIQAARDLVAACPPEDGQS